MQIENVPYIYMCVCVCDDDDRTKEKSRSRTQHLKLSRRFDTNCIFFKRAISPLFETAFLQW